MGIPLFNKHSGKGLTYKMVPTETVSHKETSRIGILNLNSGPTGEL